MWEHVAEGVGHRPDPPGGRKSVRDFLLYPVLSCLILLGHLRKIDHWSILGRRMSAYNDFLLGHLRKIDHGSILGKGMSAYGAFLLDPAWFPFENRLLVDFQEGPKQHQAD